ncbi:hypothetical protein SAMN04489711_12610 [Paracidovorax wautersii]|uniref:Uncharacterized protein n=2 Tax=Paracidovorax wautersii TaxID=1177982 RepID=A0A1I2HM39_9BURK|nr:hypothetical protein SAMN04489711_12610 [Paracidovorax wautersii]
MGIGALAAYLPYAKGSNALQAALEHIENGAVPNEPPEYAQLMDKESRVQPKAAVLAGTYTNITKVNGVTYNAVIALQTGGKYEYALTVGTPRVYKLYKHSGEWWVSGRVLNIVFKEGDEFLAAPANRDHKTPAREHILAVTPDSITLQAHYGSPVVFNKAAQ